MATKAGNINTGGTEPLAHSPEGASRRIGVPLRTVYTLIATGELRSFKEGKRRLIPDIECVGYVQRKLAATREVSA